MVSRQQKRRLKTVLWAAMLGLGLFLLGRSFWKRQSADGSLQINYPNDMLSLAKKEALKRKATVADTVVRVETEDFQMPDMAIDKVLEKAEQRRRAKEEKEQEGRETAPSAADVNSEIKSALDAIAKMLSSNDDKSNSGVYLFLN